MHACLPFTIKGHVAVITMSNAPANTWTHDSLDGLADLILDFNQDKNIYSLSHNGCGGEVFFCWG